MVSGQEYAKFFYWVDASRIEAFLDGVKSEFHLQSIPRARQRPCEALNHTFPAVHVPPEVWSTNCYRQASWFRTSALKDKHLLVTTTEVPVPDAILAGSITKISQPCVPVATRSQYLPLLEAPEFKSRAPAEWFHLLDREIPVFKGFLEHICESVDLDEFLAKHSANHAQFLVPPGNEILNINIEGKHVPCSLFPSTFICSACLELFGVIGSHIQKKALKNCPGLKYAPLGADEYFLVVIGGGSPGSECQAERV